MPLPWKTKNRGNVSTSLMCAGCSGHDDQYYPYTMTGLRAFVYDNRTGKEYFAGEIGGNYLQREKTAAQCGYAASSTANFNNLRDWSYVCCTVTPSSSCMTKVR